MDSTTNYLAQAKDAKDGSKPKIEDEDTVVFANGTTSNGLGAGKTAGESGSGASDSADAAGDGARVESSAATPNSDDASALVDSFKGLSVNTKSEQYKYEQQLNDYRPKYPTINVSHGDANASAGADWQSKGPRKNGEDSSYGPMYGRPLNASASDFQVRGGAAPAYPGYAAPNGAYGSYQPGAPPMHGSYVTHGYDVFGLSPTLTEPPVNGPGGPNGAANGNATNGNRYGPHRNSNATDPSGMGLSLNGLNTAAGPAPYSPIPMSPSPLSLNPYAAHHHAQMQHHAHMNGHAMGPYMPPPPNGAPGKNDGSGAPSMSNGSGQASGPGSANPNGPPSANGANRSYPPAFTPGVPYGQQYYDESAMYANYGTPHLQHGMHPGYAQMPPHPGTPQLSAYGGYMPPMVGMPGAGTPGMLPIPGPGANGQSPTGTQQNGAPQQNGGTVNPSAPPVHSIVNGLTLINGVPQPNADGTGPSANNRKLGLYKTELCRSWEEKGSCRYGPKCQFAHGEEEIRKVARHPKYKTEICRTFWLSGSCPYGKRCCFIHTDAPANGNGGEAGKAGTGTGPSTAAAGAPAPANGDANAPTHTRNTSTASEMPDQPPSSMLARINAKQRDADKTPSPQGPARIVTNTRPDFSHNRHLSSMSDGRPTEVDTKTAYAPLPRPGHSHSASAHSLMTPTFTAPSPGVNGFGSSNGTPTGVDGNGNLTPGSYWGHKRSASGGSATAGWNSNPEALTTQPEQQLRSIYSALTPTA